MNRGNRVLRILWRAVWLYVLFGTTAHALSTVAPEEAINHVGEQAIVCGTVASANYATGSNRQPTFLNLDRPYPNHVFTALTWGKDRSKFPYPPESGRVQVGFLNHREPQSVQLPAQGLRVVDGVIQVRPAPVRANLEGWSP